MQDSCCIEEEIMIIHGRKRYGCLGPASSSCTWMVRMYTIPNGTPYSSPCAGHGPGGVLGREGEATVLNFVILGVGAGHIHKLGIGQYAIPVTSIRQ